MLTIESLRQAQGLGMALGLAVMATSIVYRLGMRETVKTMVYIARKGR